MGFPTPRQSPYLSKPDVSSVLAKTMSPYLKIADIAGARMLRAAGELGFSPSSRPKLSSWAKAAKGDDGVDFWSQFNLPAGVP
jgi:phage terminase small subunit